MMKIRFATICFLVLVLLNGATGSVLAAVFCPNVTGLMTCCSAQEMEQEGRMDGMDMGGTAARTSAEQSTETGSINNLMESCAHCITHTQPVNAVAFWSEADQKDCHAVRAAPAASAHLVIPPSHLIYSITAKPHAPPAVQSPKYILLNVFRI